MGNNKNEAKLKASIAEFVGPLLKRLKLAEDVYENLEMATIIDQIRTEVIKRKYSIDNIQNRDWELTGLFGKIERQIDSWIDHNEKRDEMNESTLTTKLNDILRKLSQIPTEKAPDLLQKGKTTEVTESSNRSYQENELSMDLKDLEELDVHSVVCLYSLGIFPESTELEKRFVIYWWIGLGLLPWTSWKEAKKRGNEIYSDLKKKGFLKSVHIEKHDEVINRCTINPTVHKWLFSPNEKNNFIFKSDKTSLPFFGDRFKEMVLINLGQNYLKSDDIKINNNVQVVLLGSWCYTETEVHNEVKETGSKNTIDHIEIDKTDFLNGLGEKTTYISMRGISGIEEIHGSVGKLENLLILDLRSCHNLIKLPEKPRSRQKLRSTLKEKLLGLKLPEESWFNKLMVLDISGCYLLDHMPKWICELSNLEVLKGFVVGNVGKKNQPCRLGDLLKLNKLRKLTIRIVRDHLVTEEFSGLKHLHTLLVLTIMWGDNKSNSVIPASSFPENLEKLDIRCYPKDEASEMLNPAELKNLKRLYIRGGKLTKLPCEENWGVEKLRLRFLKYLNDPTDLEKIRCGFQNLKYVEYVECPKLENFPKGGCSWSKEKDEP
ncbi:disease resistance RPP13-like protein 4 [Carex littledalei]|uniref:Disease resistance RPP13-like protein 4 n=1 Tax=Carex littledalei TaxID=544730 RepID=A0A833VXH4_9POAL|nr:disease resistance RPP13-like protein 4 [Carex littledalei]